MKILVLTFLKIFKILSPERVTVSKIVWPCEGVIVNNENQKIFIGLR